MISSNDLLNSLKLIYSVPYRCGHTLKIPTLKQPYRVHAKHRRQGHEQVALSTPIQKPSFQVNIIMKEDVVNKLKEIYSENALQFRKHKHPIAKIELTQVYIKEKPMFYTPEDIKQFSIQIKELSEKLLIRPAKVSYSSLALWL